MTGAWLPEAWETARRGFQCNGVLVVDTYQDALLQIHQGVCCRCRVIRTCQGKVIKCNKHASLAADRGSPGGCARLGAEADGNALYPSAQFCCEPEIALKLAF